jgi:hypothetical protein
MHRSTKRFWDFYSSLPGEIRRLADKSFDLLKNDASHPSLHFKKVGNFWYTVLNDSEIITMTTLLANAFEEASKLPESDQDALAKWLLDELHSEKRWAESFAESQDILEKLADEALEEKKQGKTSPLDLDRL